MAEPYATSSSKSFQAARTYATTDPKLLRRQSIDAGLAEKWREVVLPQPLLPTSNVLAALFGYDLHPELPDELIWLRRTPVGVPSIVFVHDFTGMLWGLDALMRALDAPCLGIQCSRRLIEDCYNMQELAARYVRLIPPSARKPAQLIAYSLGCLIAHHMACILEQQGECVRLVLLDGPVGADSELPPRMGGSSSTVVEILRSRQVLFAQSLTSSTIQAALGHLLGVLIAAGNDAADAAAALIEMPNYEVPQAGHSVAALHIAAAESVNRTNSVIEVSQMYLPGLKVVTVAGGHFDFIQLSATAIAELVGTFLSPS